MIVFWNCSDSDFSVNFIGYVQVDWYILQGYNIFATIAAHPTHEINTKIFMDLIHD